MRNLLLASVALAAALGIAASSHAQTGPATVVSGGSCPVANVLNVGNGRALIETQLGGLCINGTITVTGSTVITGPLGRQADAASVSVALSTQNVADLEGPIPTQASTVSIGGVGLLSGSAKFGQAAIDQTTPGTTNNVTISTNVGTLPLIQATASVPITFTAAGGPTQIIAASGSTKIYITHWDVTVSGAGTFALITGTGTNCGTGTTYLTGASGHPLSFAANGGGSYGSGLGPILITGAGGEVCAITTGAVDQSGSIAYAQF